MIVGIDIGNITTVAVTKDNTVVLESRIKESTALNELESSTFIFEGKKYILEGEFENNYNKHEKDNFLPLLYYSIAKATSENKVRVVIGIPAGQYNTSSKELEKIILENNFRKIKIDENERQIHIENVKVVPESYGLKANGELNKCQKNFKTIVVDIGGGTTDIAEFSEKGSFVEGHSIKFGLLDIYRETRTILENAPYNMYLTLEDAKKYFDGELELLSQDISYKKPIMVNCIRKIVNELRGLYPNLANINIILTGGGAEKIYPTFKQLYPQTIPVMDVKANAIGFYKVGETLWSNK